jgi:hypothetical protein
MEQNPGILEASAARVAAFGNTAASYAALTDEQLLAAQEEINAFRRHGDTRGAWCAGEIAKRSARELGHSGLAQRNGFATPEAMIQAGSGSTRNEAAKLVKVGTLMAETDAAVKVLDDDPASPFATIPWLAPVARAVSAGTLTLDAAEAIRKGLGEIDPGVPAEKLLAAAGYLLEQAVAVTVDANGGNARLTTGLNADQLLRLAHRLRDELDADGIATRAKTRHDARSFKIWRQPDGMYRVSALLDPEDGRYLETIYEQATSPRRGGPRFVDKAAQTAAKQLQRDDRTTEHIAADAFLALLRLGVNADPGAIIIGNHRPAVRVIVTEDTLNQGTGHGRIEGHPDPVPFETIQRQICDTGTVGILFTDDAQCVNVGREQRLFTNRQRIGIAVRDGGCRWPGCDKPASWTEAHHINHWDRDHGGTDIADGICLCRFHHLLLHNNHWDILRTRGTYSLRPPVTIDPTQTLRPMPSKNPQMLQLITGSSTTKPTTSASSIGATSSTISAGSTGWPGSTASTGWTGSPGSPGSIRVQKLVAPPHNRRLESREGPRLQPRHAPTLVPNVPHGPPG